MRKGIILCGGLGSRLKPLTNIYSKHLLPVYDKPMIYYPLYNLLKMGIKEILFISDKKSIKDYKKLFKNGKQFGCKFDYKIQDKPKGIAEALIIGENFLDNSPCVLILGDNVFYGDAVNKLFLNANKSKKNSFFLCEVSEPNRYGVYDFKNNKIIEKPKKKVSNYAVVGIYFYDKHCSKYAKILKPSKRLELEITDLNNIYLKKTKCNLIKFDKGTTWLDTGTFDSLLNASNFFKTISKRSNRNMINLNEFKK